MKRKDGEMKREGVELLLHNPKVAKTKEGIEALEFCSEKYGGCDDCTDRKECVKIFDIHCEIKENRNG